MLSQNNDDFVFPINMRLESQAKFMEKIYTAKFYLYSQKDPLEFLHIRMGDVHDGAAVKPWVRSKRDAKAAYLARRFVRPAFHRFLEFDIDHFRPMPKEKFTKFATDAIMEDIKKRKEKERNELMEYLKTHFEVGLFFLFFFYESTETEHKRIRKIILLVIFCAQVAISIAILMSSYKKYEEMGFVFCEATTITTPGMERAAGLLIGLIYAALSYLRLVSHGNPSGFYRLRTTGARRVISMERFMYLFYKEFLQISYLWILSAETDARSMIINSGALEFWLNFDSTAKKIYIFVFPLDAEEMLRSTRADPELPTNTAWQSTVRNIRKVLPCVTLGMAFFLPICKPDFSDECSSSLLSMQPSLSAVPSESLEPSMQSSVSGKPSLSASTSSTEPSFQRSIMPSNEPST